MLRRGPALKAGVRPIERRLDLRFLEIAHSGERRAASGPCDQALDRRFVALQKGFNAAVGAVANPSVDAETPRLREHRIAIANALHAPGDTDLPRSHIVVGAHVKLPAKGQQVKKKGASRCVSDC
jgi:hypothetical protein